MLLTLCVKYKKRCVGFSSILLYYSLLLRDMTVPFCNWTTEQVCGWLEDYGLGQYVNLARQWVISGQTLLSATPQDFEKVSLTLNPTREGLIFFRVAFLKLITTYTVIQLDPVHYSSLIGQAEFQECEYFL